jgi:phosphoglycerate dehydrogenase-like enzyme
MNDNPLFVLTAPGDRSIRFLAELRQMATIMVGDSGRDFANAAVHAEIVLNWSGSLALPREVFLMSRRVRWIHSRSAGLEQTLFPELIESEVIVTNGRGVFSPSLGEFALAAILWPTSFATQVLTSSRGTVCGSAGPTSRSCWALRAVAPRP